MAENDSDTARRRPPNPEALTADGHGACTEEMAETRRRREQLISTVVHDLRGPLTSIMGFSQLIERALSQGKPCERRHVEIIAREARRLNAMVDELADLSLVEAKRLELERQPTDIVLLARALVEETGKAAPSSKLALEAPVRPLVGNWDPDRLAQALRYLIENAVRFSPEQAQITVRIEPDGDQVRGTIVDQGAHVPEELLPLVFAPFSRFHQERRTKGMGMGLFIAKGIVEALGGRIWVESEPDRGNRFIFLLPLNAP